MLDPLFLTSPHSVGQLRAAQRAFHAARRPLQLLLAALVLCVAAAPAPASAQLSEPVDAPVVDPFRPPDHIGAPGNRGWEYAVAPGTAVLAAADGVVVFAGRIGANLYVSIDHPLGLRSSYAYLGSVTVSEGQPVTRGATIGTTTHTLHFGVRRDGQYVDPAGVVGAASQGVQAYLVPVAEPVARTGPPASLSGPPQYTLGLAHPWVR